MAEEDSAFAVIGFIALVGLLIVSTVYMAIHLTTYYELPTGAWRCEVYDHKADMCVAYTNYRIWKEIDQPKDTAHAE